MARNSQKILGGTLLAIGLFLDINPLTLVIGIPIMLAGIFFLVRKVHR